MKHDVSFRTTLNGWAWQASFSLHGDAVEYARSLSRKINRDTIVRVESDRDYVNVYFRDGEEVTNEEYAA